VTYSVADYERDAERFCQAAGARRHRYVSGRAPSLDLSSLFEDWGHLFGLDLIEQLGQEAIEPNRRRALVAFAVQGRLARATRRQTTRLTEVEAAATVVWEQQALPLGSVAPRLANMADVPARHRLDAARRACIEQERGARVSRLEAWRDAHEDLLERDPVAHADRLLGLGLEALQAQAAQLLEATDGVYRDALAAAGRLAGLERGDIWSADLDWLTRAPEFDSALPARALGPAVRRTLLALGQRQEEQSAIVLDPELPPQHADRPACVALHVPLELHVLFAPRGGWRDYATLLGLLGEAEFLANVDPALPFPYRWLGDGALAPGYGALLAGLVRDPLWLAAAADGGELADLRQRTLLAWLIELRRDAALLGYELRLRRAPPGDWEAWEAAYAQELGAALGARHFGEEFLRAVDEPFAAAQRLRGALFGEQLRAYLVSEWDEEWFRSPRAARFLLELWREGTRYTSDELLRFMGYAGFDLAPLLDQVRAPAGGAP